MRAPGPGGPRPVGDGILESVEGHPQGPLWREAAQSHRREGGGPGRLLARPGRTQSPSPPALELPRATVCAVRAMTGQTPPVPGRLPVDSRGKWAGSQAEEGAPLPSKDRDGHTAGRGLPRTEASCQPLLGEQACGRQDRQVAGGRGAGLASDSPAREAEAPGPAGLPRDTCM